MATMASKRAAVDHGDEVWLLKLTLDQCTRENKYMYAAEATCAATSKCYYTYATCKDTANYNKGTHVYQFCSRGAWIPGAYPYLKKPRQILPTEIDPKNFKTSRGKITFELEADTAHVYSSPDKAFDTAKESEARDTGLFWPNWVKRNVAYRGRIAELYFGYKGVSTASYELKFRGVIDNIEYDKYGVKIACLDLLWACVLNDTPAKISSTITVSDNPLAVGDTTLHLDNDGVTNFTASDHFETPDYDSGASTINQYRYVKIEDEIIAYTGITDGAGAALTGLVRGVMGTTAAEHAQATAIEQVNYYAETSAGVAWASLAGLPPDHIFADLICNLGGVAAGYLETWTTGIATLIDGNQLATATTITVTDIADLPGEGIVLVGSELIRYTGISGATLTGCKRGCYGTTAAALADDAAVVPITFTQWLGNWVQGSRYKYRWESSSKVSNRINTVRRDTMMDVWVNDSGNVEGNLTTWAAYGTAPTTYTDLDIVNGKRKIDREEKIRITRVLVYGNPPAADAGDSVDDYEGGLIRGYIDTVAEGSNSFDEKRERILFCPGIYRSNEADLRAAREFMVNRSARPKVTFELEVKDEAEATGDLIKLTLDEIVDEDGATDTRFYKILKKRVKPGGIVEYAAKDIGFGDKRYCLISSDADTYDATSADKDIYGWISDATDTVGAAGDPGYDIF